MPGLSGEEMTRKKIWDGLPSRESKFTPGLEMPREEEGGFDAFELAVGDGDALADGRAPEFLPLDELFVEVLVLGDPVLRLQIVHHLLQDILPGPGLEVEEDQGLRRAGYGVSFRFDEPDVAVLPAEEDGPLLGTFLAEDEDLPVLHVQLQDRLLHGHRLHGVVRAPEDPPLRLLGLGGQGEVLPLAALPPLAAPGTFPAPS